MEYYSIINETIFLSLKNGLNIYHDRFEIFPGKYPNGFYFTTLDNITNLYKYGNILIVLELPDNIRKFKLPMINIWKSDRIFLKNNFILSDLNTYMKFKITIHNPYVINILYTNKNLLNWIKTNLKNINNLISNDNLIYDKNNNDNNDKNNDKNNDDNDNDNNDDKNKKKFILTPEQKKVYDIIKTDDNMKAWFKLNWPLFINNSNIIDYLSITGNIKYLDVWKNYKNINNPITLYYSHDSIDKLNCKNKIEVIKWWLDSGLEIKYTSEALFNISKQNDIKTLEWWKISGLSLKYNSDIIDYASCYGQLNVLEWWKNSSLDIRYTSKAIDYASKFGFITSLNWWKESNLELKYTNKAFDGALKNGYIDILEWWKNNNFQIKYSKKIIQWLLDNNKKNIINWCKNNNIL